MPWCPGKYRPWSVIQSRKLWVARCLLYSQTAVHMDFGTHSWHIDTLGTGALHISKIPLSDSLDIVLPHEYQLLRSDSCM